MGLRLKAPAVAKQHEEEACVEYEGGDGTDDGEVSCIPPKPDHGYGEDNKAEAEGGPEQAMDLPLAMRGGYSCWARW